MGRPRGRATDRPGEGPDECRTKGGDMGAEQGGSAAGGAVGGRGDNRGDDDNTVDIAALTDASTGVITLAGIHNFRDVAGPGYPVSSGGTMARGIVFRSAAISATDGDVGVLEKLGVATIVDLRTEGEVAQQPDVPVPGAQNIEVDILQGNSTAATLMNSGIVQVEDARREMALTYERFVTGADERRAFGRAVEAVAASSGASIVHCTAGKDRTGWISATLQLLAGVSHEDVVANYLITRETSKDLTEAIMQYVRVKMPHQADAIEVLLGVEESNIRRSLELLDSEFGDIQTYLTQGAGVDAAVVDALGARLRG